MLNDEQIDKLINALESQRDYCDALYCKSSTRKIVRDWFEAAQQSEQTDDNSSYYLVEDNDEMYGTGPHRLERSRRR